ncbi:MAG: dihydroneopterin aldolase [Solirubrobacterales bacterium]
MADLDRSPVTIRIEGMVVHTHHGVTEAERELGQRMLFDLELEVPECGATSSDRVEETVDYGELAELVAELATVESRLTLERLVDLIAREVLDRYPVSSVTVRATKPEPPVPFTMDGASVELTLSDGD